MDNMNIELVLKEIGLAGNEIRVYTALLELGSCLAGEITKRSGVNRTNVYDALDRLIDKGLVTYVISANRKYFEAATPERIINYLDEREKELKKKKRLVSAVIPEIDAKRKLSREQQEATIYKGKKGIKSLAEDVLKTKKEMLVYGAEGMFVDLFRHYAEQWHMRRAKLRIPIKIIYNEKIKKKKSKAKYRMFSMRFNSNIFDTPSTTWVYGEKTAIIVWSDQPIATVIRSREVAQSYREFFKILWKDSRA